jgi:hypothetical protein
MSAAQARNVLGGRPLMFSAVDVIGSGCVTSLDQAAIV